MIRYYAYYSYGGFKDMLVGSQADTSVCNYYLPLVDSGIETDESKKNAPRIKIAGDKNADSLPSGIARLVSNGGYSIFFSRNFNGNSVLVVRDVTGSGKDENGRSIPFVVELVGDTTDKETLASAASFFLRNEGESDKILGPLFHYDAELNGLCFENKKLTDWLDSLKGAPTTVETVDKSTIDLLHTKNPSFLCSTVINDTSNLLSRLGLQKDNVTEESITRILPENDNASRQKRIKDWTIYQNEIKKKRLIAYAIAGGIAAIGIAAYFLFIREGQNI